MMMVSHDEALRKRRDEMDAWTRVASNVRGSRRSTGRENGHGGRFPLLPRSRMYVSLRSFRHVSSARALRFAQSRSIRSFFDPTLETKTHPGENEIVRMLLLSYDPSV